MNEVIRQLFERKSVRVYTGQEISKEEKELILTAAAQAPTAGNQLFYTILDITDQKIKDRLAVTCDSQPFIAEAKMVLIFCADCGSRLTFSHNTTRRKLADGTVKLYERDCYRCYRKINEAYPTVRKRRDHEAT